MAVDSFSEVGLVSISAINGTEREYATLVETVDIAQGDKDIEAIPTLAGGRIVKFNPQEPTEITLEAYPMGAATASGATGLGFYDLMHTTSDATQPLVVQADRTRQKVRCVITFTADPTVTSAVAATTGTYEGFRVIATNGYVVSVNPSFTDGILKSTIRMKFPAFAKDGSSNVSFVSTTGSAVLPAVAAYTG